MGFINKNTHIRVYKKGDIVEIIKDFINILIDEGCIIEDKIKMENYLKEKSVYRYRQIYKSLRETEEIITDSNLHDYYIYDIRVRRLLFKYLTAYEISLRGNILNELDSNHEIVDNYSFGKLVNLYYKNEISYDNVRLLRNQVMHHKMIQLCDESVVLNGINSMLDKMDKKKFLSELNSKKKNLDLLGYYYEYRGVVKYGMGIKV